MDWISIKQSFLILQLTDFKMTHDIDVRIINTSFSAKKWASLYVICLSCSKSKKATKSNQVPSH